MKFDCFPKSQPKNDFRPFRAKNDSHFVTGMYGSKERICTRRERYSIVPNALVITRALDITAISYELM